MRRTAHLKKLLVKLPGLLNALTRALLSLKASETIQVQRRSSDGTTLSLLVYELRQLLQVFEKALSVLSWDTASVGSPFTGDAWKELSQGHGSRIAIASGSVLPWARRGASPRRRSVSNNMSRRTDRTHKSVGETDLVLDILPQLANTVNTFFHKRTSLTK